MHGHQLLVLRCAHRHARAQPHTGARIKAKQAHCRQEQHAPSRTLRAMCDCRQRQITKQAVLVTGPTSPSSNSAHVTCDMSVPFSVHCSAAGGAANAACQSGQAGQSTAVVACSCSPCVLAMGPTDAHPLWMISLHGTSLGSRRPIWIISLCGMSPRSQAAVNI